MPSNIKIMKKNIHCLVILLFSFLYVSCSSIHAGLYLLSLDNEAGKFYIQNEQNVKRYLENVIEFNEEYYIKAFDRTGINYEIKRTNLLTHCYYVIFNNDGSYRTLSFNGTEIKFSSKGAWALDTETDTSSHELYLEGNNLWGVQEMFFGEKIDVVKTLTNVIGMIGSDITYYYRDHINNMPKKNNCITALYETVAFEDY